MISVGTSNFLRSSWKSVSENALMLSERFLRPPCMLHSQNWSSIPCETFRAWSIGAIEHDGEVFPELRTVLSETAAQSVENFERNPFWVGSRLHRLSNELGLSQSFRFG